MCDGHSRALLWLCADLWALRENITVALSQVSLIRAHSQPSAPMPACNTLTPILQRGPVFKYDFSFESFAQLDQMVVEIRRRWTKPQTHSRSFARIVQHRLFLSFASQVSRGARRFGRPVRRRRGGAGAHCCAPTARANTRSQVVGYGHLGDGNLHLNVSTQHERPQDVGACLCGCDRFSVLFATVSRVVIRSGRS